MITELPPLPEAARIRTPFSLRLARVFLGLLIVLWAFGAFRMAAHLATGLEAQETSRELVADALVLLRRVLLAAVAAMSVWAIGRRKQWGRWLTVGLSSYILIDSMRLLVQVWRQAQGDLPPPSDLPAKYVTTEALFGAFFFYCIWSLALAAFVWRLATARNLAKYFETQGIDANDQS